MGRHNGISTGRWAAFALLVTGGMLAAQGPYSPYGSGRQMPPRNAPPRNTASSLYGGGSSLYSSGWSPTGRYGSTGQFFQSGLAGMNYGYGSGALRNNPQATTPGARANWRSNRHGGNRFNSASASGTSGYARSGPRPPVPRPPIIIQPSWSRPGSGYRRF